MKCYMKCCLLSKCFASMPCLDVSILAKYARHPRSSEQASQPKFLVVRHPTAHTNMFNGLAKCNAVRNALNAPSCPKDCCQNTCKNTRWAPKAKLTGAASCQQWQRRLPPGKLLPQWLLQQPQCQVRHGSAPNLNFESARTATNCCMQMCSEPT